jgi:hypothetical protein
MIAELVQGVASRESQAQTDNGNIAWHGSSKTLFRGLQRLTPIDHFDDGYSIEGNRQINPPDKIAMQ